MKNFKKIFASFLLLTFVLFTLVQGFPTSALAANGENIRGIYVVDSSAGTYRDANIRDYSFVEGYTWRYNWSDIETSQGVYDFAAIDHIIGRLEPIGKKLQAFILRPEPAYIRNDSTILRWYDYEVPNGQTDPTGYRPVPWEPKVLDALDAFAAALANHQVYSSTLGRNVALKDHPTLAFISFGLAGAKKWIRDPKTTGEPDNPDLKDMVGYSRANLKNAVLRNLHAVTNNFPNQETHIGFWKITNDGGTPELWDDVRTAVLNEFNGINNPKVGFFQENLAASRATPSDPVVGTPTTAFAQPLYDSRNQTFIDFQALQAWTNPFSNPAKTQYTVPSDAINYAYNTFNSRHVELYVDDLDYAYNNPSWDPALPGWNDTLKGTTPTPPPTLVFSDDFEDGNAAGWTTSGGTWSVVTDGTKVNQQSNTGAATPNSYAGSSSWTNYSVQAAVKPLSIGSSGQVGISARYTDPANRYYFIYSKADNKIKILKKVGGNNTLLASKIYTINENATYTFKADLNGTTLDFYVNGVKELTATDSSFSSGYIALSTATSSAEFDDVKVYLH